MTSEASFRPDPEMFDRVYRGEPRFEGGPAPAGIPWDIGAAQPRLMELEALGGISGEVLDIGCGPGDNAAIGVEIICNLRIRLESNEL